MSNLTKLLQDKIAKATASLAKSETTTGKSSRDELEEKLNELDKEYIKNSTLNRLPETPVYEKKEYDAPTDEEIKTQVETELESDKVSGLEKIETDSAEAKKAKEDEKASLAEETEKKKGELSSTYDEAVESFSQDALKRGMARSSVAVNGIASLEKSRAEALNLAVKEADSELKAIDEEIASLETSRAKALDAFNIAHAAKVTERIAELTEARDEKVAEVLEYNNKMLQQEMQDAYDKMALESDLETEYLKQLQLKEELGESDAALSEKNKAKYEAVRSYLLGMSAEEAREAVRSDALVRDSLTDYYYYRLYNEFV